MELFYTLPSTSTNAKPVVLSIGNFDGFHLGHQALISRLQEVAKSQNAKSAVITFSSHPSTILRPNCPVPLLCTEEQKTKLLSESGIDQLYSLEFTQDFSEQSAEDFLTYLKAYLPFTHLVLGSDARLGKDRQGDKLTVEALAKKLGFIVEYFPDYLIDGERVSSGRIRELISKGSIDQVSRLLGRPYSIYSQVIRGSGKGTAIGFPTANIGLDSLCLPPFGVYVVRLECDGAVYKGVANIGIAPTLKHQQTATMEVHLFNQSVDLYGKFVNTILMQFIRPEKRFENIDELKLQIARDVMVAQRALDSIN